MATTRDYEPNVVLSNQDYNVVGTRPLRPDGADKVTGRALYGADFAAHIYRVSDCLLAFLL